ncbi:MAG TPA: NUDIX domain-containing protein [Polyangiaceae bacterium]|jgi:ADP-ribose pyrophosphatase|nr:NUDIX domain-containing protein [Polyangiaceae bacterium]
MSVKSGPPEFPSIRLELIEDISPAADPGFLRLVRRKLRAHYPDGTVSSPFVYDEVDRKSIDAVVIVAHHVATDGTRRVYLRSALRPPVYFRGASRAPIALPDTKGGLWELPAGLVEQDEQTPEGVVAGAARELNEEVGFDVSVEQFRPLGPSMYPSPGVIAERHFFYEVVVEPTKRAEPGLDGSALEKDGVILEVTLREGLAMCARGEIEDGKTELALRRLAERYP